MLAAARAEAQRERESQKAELVALRRGQVRTLAADAASAGREIVVRLLERVGGPDLEHALLDSARRQLAGLSEAGPLATVIVESAGSMAPDALSSLAEAAKQNVSSLQHRVVPELGGGVRIVTSRGLVDASVTGLATYVELALAERLGQAAEHG